MIKVLIADDEYLICQLIQQIVDWDRLGLECIGTATDGVEAYEIIQKEKPDIVITDVRMPGMSGIEIIDKTQQSGIACSFIVISGYQDYEYVKTAFLNGAYNYILKPIEEEELEQTLVKIIQGIQNSTSSQQNRNELETLQSLEEMAEKAAVLKDILNKRKMGLTYRQLNAQYQFQFDPDAVINIAVINYVQGNEADTIFERQISLKPLLDNVMLLVQPFCIEMCAFVHDSYVVVALNYHLEEKNSILDALRTVIEETRKDSLNIESEITIGIARGETKDLVDLYKEAQHALASRLVIGVNQLIEEGSYIYERIDIYQILTIEWENKFVNAVDVGNQEEIDRLIQIAWEEAGNCNKTDPQGFIYLVRAIIQRFKLHIKRIYGDAFHEMEFDNAFINLLRRSGSVYLLREGLCALIEDTAENCILNAGTREKEPIVRARQYVQEHYQEKISVSNLADMLFMNADYFSAYFKKETDITFTDYLRQFRMDIAKQQIRMQPDLSFIEIGEMVGYPDPKQFSKAFKKVVGVSPAEYRRLHR